MRRVSTLTLLTTALTAAAALTARSHSRTATLAPAPQVLPPVVPQQRLPQLRDVLEGDAYLLLAEQDGRDARVLNVLDELVRRAGSSPHVP